ncbi:MAG: response regulator transcription factor [Chitinophagaceae bacterium]|nr:MAG: response regulator transcription factor [Chitinophagaceae bacterium]
MTLPIQLAIVDDHKLLRQTWKMILERDQRLKVIAECDSGEEAIACAEKLSPHVMLMDINMTPINGFEATKRISQSHPNIKIIGVSINNQATYARNMIALGAKGYVTKNADSREMIDAILAVHAGQTYICKEVAEKMDHNRL